MFLLSLQNGIHAGWASPNIARHRMNHSEISVPPDKLPWLASADTLGATLGAVLGPMAIEFFGPRRAGLVAFIFATANWLCILVANSHVWLIIARFIGGNTVPMSVTCTAMYLGEVSASEVRGTMISISMSGIACGTLLGTFLETYLPAKITCPIYLVQCFTGVALLVFVLPESPYFLMKSRNDLKTIKSILMYFPNQDVNVKFLEVKNFVESQASIGVCEKLKSLRSGPVKKPLIMVLVLLALMKSSGTGNIAHYMEVILERGKSLMMKPQELVIYINIFVAGLRFVTCNVADKFGRKVLFVTASASMGLSLLCLGIYFHLISLNFDIQGFEWVPIVCILLTSVSFSLGFATGFTTLLSEIFPLNVKNLATPILYVNGSFLNFLLTYAYLPVMNSFGEQYMFWIHATCALLVTPLVIVFFSETKGKTLEEIQRDMIKKIKRFKL